MASSEHPDTDTTTSSIAFGRIVVYVCVVAALIVVVWALIEGGDRDLWSRPSSVLIPTVTHWTR